MMAFAQSTTNNLPPAYLLQNANRKADAVVLAEIESTKMPPGAFAATTVRIKRIYRGPLSAGALLTYYSFKEADAYPQSWLDHGVIVFLRRQDSAGTKQWGEAGDIFEFEYSPALEKRVISLTKRRRK